MIEKHYQGGVMVNAVSSAAQQISTNLAKLRENSSSNTAANDVGQENKSAEDSNQYSKTGSNSASLGSKVSQGLIRLRSEGDGTNIENKINSVARSGVEVSLSDAAKSILNNS